MRIDESLLTSMFIFCSLAYRNNIRPTKKLHQKQINKWVLHNLKENVTFVNQGPEDIGVIRWIFLEEFASKTVKFTKIMNRWSRRLVIHSLQMLILLKFISQTLLSISLWNFQWVLSWKDFRKAPYINYACTVVIPILALPKTVSVNRVWVAKWIYKAPAIWMQHVDVTSSNIVESDMLHSFGHHAVRCTMLHDVRWYWAKFDFHQTSYSTPSNISFVHCTGVNS